MNRVLCIIFTAILIVSSFTLTGCEEKNPHKVVIEPSEETVRETSEQPVQSEKTIKEYLDSFAEGDNDFYGAWQLKGFKYMSVVFRNDNLAELVMGTEGYFSKYTVSKGKKTLTVQLMPGVIDGTYSYEFSKDKKTLTLTLDGTSITLTKKKNFSLVPDAPDNPAINSDILGWWENEDGLVYCFQNDGVMYENSISMETCYTYSVKNGKIKAVYISGDEMKEEFSYSVEDGKFILNGTALSKKEM